MLNTVANTARTADKSGLVSPSLLNIIGPQHHVFPEIATQLSGGHLDRAEELARSIAEPSHQAEALREVAKAASQSEARPERHRALRITASLLTTPWWPQAMPILAVLDPPAVDAAAAAFLATFKTDPG